MLAHSSRANVNVTWTPSHWDGLCTRKWPTFTSLWGRHLDCFNLELLLWSPGHCGLARNHLARGRHLVRGKMYWCEVDAVIGVNALL